MRAEMYPIPDCLAGRLAIMPRPRAYDWLDDEAVSWRMKGLDIVVSLLEDDEVAELGLTDEPKACERAGLRFVRFRIAAYPRRLLPYRSWYRPWFRICGKAGALACTAGSGSGGRHRWRCACCPLSGCRSRRGGRRFSGPEGARFQTHWRSGCGSRNGSPGSVCPSKGTTNRSPKLST